MTKCLVLICGPPACLKSTLVQILHLILNHDRILNLQFLCVKKFFEILLKKKSNQLQYTFLSFDQLFLGYEHEIIANESKWKSYRSLIADEIERLILFKTQTTSSSDLTYALQILDRLYHSLEHLHNDNSILIIDDNFYYSSMRHRYRQIAQRARIGFLSIHMYSDLSIARQRNQQREISKRVSDYSIENIYSKYELLPDDFVINTTERGLTMEHLHQILGRIERACHEPEQPMNVIDEEQRRIATEINEQNLIYQVDQRLRKFISKHLKDKFSTHEKFQISNEKKLYAEMVNDARQRFLDLIKQKVMVINDIEERFEHFLRENN